ncbi:MAG: porin, partial [Chloroflexales bacterium]
IKQSIQNIEFPNAGAGRINKSQWRLTDNASRYTIRVKEDLGSGLTALAVFEQRFAPNTDPLVPQAGGGETYVGLSSNVLGTLTMGRHEVHYGNSQEKSSAVGGLLQGGHTGMFDYINGTGVGTSRELGTIRYTSVPWNDIGMVMAWGGGNPSRGQSGDMVCAGGGTAAAPGTSCTVAAPQGITRRKGSFISINPEYSAGPIKAGYSYYVNHPDLVAADGTTYAVTTDTRSDVLYGAYKVGSWDFGLGWNHSKMYNAATRALTQDRTTITPSVMYTMGPHIFNVGYTKASKSKNAAGDIANTGADLKTLNYSYNFSKRTTASLTWTYLTNKAASTYQLYTLTSYSGLEAAPVAGENQRSYALTINHKF